jgi:Skp family chaperone for outer membrane proteins
MHAGIVVVDTARLLDETSAGKAGAKRLEVAFAEKRAAFEKLRDKGSSPQGQQKAKEAAAAFEREALESLEAERAQLREGVMQAARAALHTIMADRGAAVVVDARVAVAFDPAADVTDAVIKAMG